MTTSWSSCACVEPLRRSAGWTRRRECRWCAPLTRPPGSPNLRCPSAAASRSQRSLAQIKEHRVGNYWSSVRPIIIDQHDATALPEKRDEGQPPEPVAGGAGLGTVQYKYAVFSKAGGKFLRWESFDGHRGLNLDRAFCCVRHLLPHAALATAAALLRADREYRRLPCCSVACARTNQRFPRQPHRRRCATGRRRIACRCTACAVTPRGGDVVVRRFAYCYSEGGTAHNF